MATNLFIYLVYLTDSSAFYVIIVALMYQTVNYGILQFKYLICALYLLFFNRILSAEALGQ